jgi:hypothetical protein
MASTYVNDLRLNEMATGDGSGTWGTTTNTNLELIAEAFSYGTEVITTNADTHTTTIADGATDPGRSLYLKYTGTLDSACTITIGPNTVSKVWIIENGTSGSQNIILSQGSGANITIPAGDTKVVYSDGAGAGAAFFDAFASLSVVDLKVQDDLTVTDAALVTGVLTTTATQVATGGITSGSDIISDTDSTDSLGSTGVRWLKGWFDTLTAGTLTVGSGSVTDSSGAISFGDENLTTTGIVTAAGTSVFTNLDISGDVDVDGTTNLDVVDIDGAVDMASTLKVGSTITINEPAQTTFGLVSKVKSVYLSSTDATYANLTIRKEAATSTDYLQFRDSGNDLLARLTYLGGLTTYPTAGGHAVFNENGVDADFRVESDNNANALFVDDTFVKLGSLSSHPASIIAGNVEIIQCAVAGEVTMPLQPAFLVEPASQQSDLSGTTTIAFGTEIFDQGSNFASNTFTAPVTGKYQFNLTLYIVNFDVSCTYVSFYIEASNRNVEMVNSGSVFGATDPTYSSLAMGCLLDMDANDTCYIQCVQSGGAAQMDIAIYSRFSGFLVC